MKVLGLCGGSGSGKGCVSDILSGFGFAVFDTDKIYHSLLENDDGLTKALTNAFGGMILSDGRVDRKKLGAVVFSDKSGDGLKKLNTITHACILAEVRRGIEAAERDGKVCCVVDAPLLFESGFDKECDVTLAVISSREKRISRIILRDSISIDEAERRINSQIDDERLVSLCDYAVFNNGDLDELRYAVSKIASEIIRSI
jgi:dephospho-CoA kinase